MSYSSDNISLERANTNSIAFDAGDITENTVNAYANLFYPYLLDNGGNKQNIALTIDILNKEELEQDTKDFVNKKWVNKNRLDNNVSTSKAIWGFKEAFNGIKKSRALSNAFCFAGQQITFYISPKGHGTGYVDDQWVYCKTTITISATDIVNGTNTILQTFNGFEKSLTDSSRYFNWTVPSPVSSTFSDYGMFGLVVIKIDVEQSYYNDADWEETLNESVPYKNQSLLQLLVYSGTKEIIDVNAGDLNILVSTPLQSETLEQIFDNTVFDGFQSLNQNALTDAQKRAIIADQIAVLFISQHPVITADFYPSKVIGSGASEAVAPRKILNKAIVYSKKYPDIVPMVNDRLYGMMATYKAFNFVVDIEKYIPDYNQSSQVIRDPVRIIYVDSNGNPADNFGIDGIVFNPYALSVNNTDTIFDAPPAIPIDIILHDGTVDIQNIQILDPSTLEIVGPHSAYARVGFDVVYGGFNIRYVRYSVFSQDGMNYQYYNDVTGLSRYHTFKLDSEILPKPSKRGDVATAQIDIEDTDGGISSFVYSVGLHGYTPKPTLYDLKIYQRKDGSDIVDIYYTYNGLGEINNSYLVVEFSSDDGITWSEVPVTSLKGDFGNNVMPGRRRVTWKPIIDLDGITTTYPILCRLTLTDADNLEAEGDSLTGALVKDLDKPEIAIMMVPVT